MHLSGPFKWSQKLISSVSRRKCAGARQQQPLVNLREHRYNNRDYEPYALGARSGSARDRHASAVGRDNEPYALGTRSGSARDRHASAVGRDNEPYALGARSSSARDRHASAVSRDKERGSRPSRVRRR
ncbi:unnamed protein product, partial [Iphiclides podalirius]